MRILVLLALLTALVSAQRAAAEFRTIELAHEVPFEDLGLPGASYDTMSFRECGQCELITLKVTPATRYILNGQALDLGNFGVEMQRIRSQAIAEKNVVTVLQKVETGIVLSVTVQL